MEAVVFEVFETAPEAACGVNVGPEGESGAALIGSVGIVPLFHGVDTEDDAEVFRVVFFKFIGNVHVFRVTNVFVLVVGAVRVV
jgi:hypothetical protein